MSDSDIPEQFQFEKLEGPAKANWKLRAKEFFDDSTFNGILYMFASKSWATRIIWALVLLFAIGGFCTVTILNILMLVQEPISTSITITRENRLAFPAITICSLSLFNGTILQSGGDKVSEDLTSLFYEVQNDIPNVESCKMIANNLANSTHQNISWGELVTIAGNDFTALLKNCTYHGKRCTAKDFDRIITIGGFCYTFNKQKVHVANGTGVRQGLRLKLSPDHQEFSLGRDYGFRVVIHNPDELPRPESDGIVVGLNSTVYIGMRQVNSMDETQFSSGTRCKMDTDPNQELSIAGYTTYSPTLCQEECFYKYAIDKCKCVERKLYTPVSSKYKEMRNCTAPDLCCEVQAFDEVEENCACPPKCSMVERILTVSSSTNGDGYVGVNVYYESLFLETRKTTDSYTPWSLISDIGGNTGLFLGFTLLSWVELVIFLAALIKDCCCGCKTQKVTLQRDACIIE